MGFILYGCCLIGFDPQCQHHDRFDQSLLEYQKKSAHIKESTFSVHHVEIDPDVIVSCQDPLNCQNSVVLSKWDQFLEAHFFTVFFFTVHFTLFLRD